jgi:hypothetical protein
MTSHQRRFLVAIPAALCVALSASTGALAAPAGEPKADYPKTGTVAAAAGDTKADYPKTGTVAAVAGDTKGDYPGTGEPRAVYAGTYRPVALQDRSAAHVGDTPVDYPGASRAPQYNPPTTTSNRRSPTIARDGDPTLPISLAITALLLAGFATALARTRMQPRPSRS